LVSYLSSRGALIVAAGAATVLVLAVALLEQAPYERQNRESAAHT
jgi:hypothetical protein